LVQALYASAGIEVMVVNPKVVKKFREALLQRASTDVTSATALREFAERMKFQPWTPPAKACTDLQARARRAEALTELKIEEKNRLHAAETGGEPRAVLASLRKAIKGLSENLKVVREAAMEAIQGDRKLSRDYEALVSIKGVGRVSAIAILAEVSCLPRGMSVRQWVAYAGLDPRPVESGSSVKRPRRISKMGNLHLRRALFMPALVAVRYNPAVQAYAEHLEARGKPKLVIVVAVMRKLLHAIHGMLNSGTTFEGEKFYRDSQTSAATPEPKEQPVPRAPAGGNRPSVARAQRGAQRTGRVKGEIGRKAELGEANP
jgi:transposase